MRHARWLSVVGGVFLVLVSPSRAQAPAKPGPELERLKQLVGTWDLVAKVAGQEFKAVSTGKMELGGLWLVSELKGELFGQEIEVKGMITYDPAKKKYVAVYVDSRTPRLNVMEGTFDEKTQKMTATGEGPGLDGKPATHKIVFEFKDKDTAVDTRSIIDKDGKELEFMTITYKRRK